VAWGPSTAFPNDTFEAILAKAVACVVNSKRSSSWTGLYAHRAQTDRPLEQDRGRTSCYLSPTPARTSLKDADGPAGARTGGFRPAVRSPDFTFIVRSL
jgi:hypothetical protein